MILPREIIPSSSFFKESLSQGLVELRAKSGKQAGLGVRRNAMRGSHAVVGGRISFYSQCSTFCFPHFRNLTLESEWQCPPLYMIVKWEDKHLHIEDITLPAWFTRGLPEDKYMYFECTLRYSNVACWKIQDLLRWFSHDSRHFQHHETTFMNHWGIFHGIFPAFSMMKQEATVFVAIHRWVFCGIFPGQAWDTV